jgi:FkbM family methyltransferase
MIALLVILTILQNGFAYIITNNTIIGIDTPYPLGSDRTQSECLFIVPYYTNPVVKIDMCVALDSTKLKAGMSIIKILETRGYLPTCRVMQIMLWMLATTTGGILNNRIFIDVGSNIGSCSVCMASLGLSSIAIEPFPPHVKIIQASRRIHSHIHMRIYHGGAGINNTKLEVTFKHGARNYGSTMFDLKKENNSFVAREEDNSQDLQIYSLQSIIPGGKTIPLLKLDCEGCEWNALLGAGSRIQDIQMIKMELNEPSYDKNDETTRISAKDMLRYLQKSGFTIMKDLYPDAPYYFGHRINVVDVIDQSLGANHAKLEHADLKCLHDIAIQMLTSTIDVESFRYDYFLKKEGLTDIIAIKTEIYEKMLKTFKVNN